MISVCIPTYNEGSNLLRTVAALRALPPDDLDGVEIIVADDGSTDGSVDRCAEAHPGIRITRHPTPYGTSAAKALGAEAALGNVLVFLDAHTCPTPGTLPQLAAVAAELGTAVPTMATLAVDRWQPTAKAAHGMYFDLRGNWHGRQLRLAQLQPLPPRPGLPQVHHNYGLAGGGFAIRRDLYDAVGGWDRGLISWGSDCSLALRLWCLGHLLVHVPCARIGHLYRSTFQHYRPQWWQIFANRLRILESLATDAEYQRFAEPLQMHGAWSEARRYADQHAHTVARLQPRLVRSLTDYWETVRRL